MSVYVDVDLLNLPNDRTDKGYDCDKHHDKHHDKHCTNKHCTEKHCGEKHLARAYVPFQKSGKIYPPDESLAAGTVYPELYQPYKNRYGK